MYKTDDRMLCWSLAMLEGEFGSLFTVGQCLEEVLASLSLDDGVALEAEGDRPIGLFQSSKRCL